jgi:molybdopterin-binding protein
MSQVDLKLVGTDNKVSSVMTVDSLDALGVKAGDTVNVMIKAVKVFLTKR